MTIPVSEIGPSVSQDLLALLGGENPPHLRRNARDERALGHDGAFEDHRSPGDQASRADLGPRQDDAPMPTREPSPIVHPCTTAL